MKSEDQLHQRKREITAAAKKRAAEKNLVDVWLLIVYFVVFSCVFSRMKKSRSVWRQRKSRKKRMTSAKHRKAKNVSRPKPHSGTKHNEPNTRRTLTLLIRDMTICTSFLRETCWFVWSILFALLLGRDVRAISNSNSPWTIAFFVSNVRPPAQSSLELLSLIDPNTMPIAPMR